MIVAPASRQNHATTVRPNFAFAAGHTTMLAQASAHASAAKPRCRTIWAAMKYAISRPIWPDTAPPEAAFMTSVSLRRLNRVAADW